MGAGGAGMSASVATSSSIRAELEARLKADLSADGIDPLSAVLHGRDVPVRVERFPDDPTEQQLQQLASGAGAVLVRYLGSDYGKVEGGAQDRMMLFECEIITMSLAADGGMLGVEELVEKVIERLQGYRPAACWGAGEIRKDGLIEKTARVWRYSVVVSFGAYGREHVFS